MMSYRVYYNTKSALYQEKNKKNFTDISLHVILNETVTAFFIINTGIKI